jgi:hypothetical protein
MKPIGKALAALAIFVLAIAAAGSMAAVTARLDRQQAAMGDTLRLTVVATDDEDLGKLDLQPLQRDFEILQRSTSSKTSYTNGQFSSTRELLVDITPRREGALTVPPLQVDGQQTPALPVAVGPAPKGISGDQNVIFDAELDHSSVYVQGQVILTLRLQQAINLDDRNITQLQLDNAFVRPLEQNSYQRTVNGRPWLVHEVRYAIFPEQSGTLEIPAQTFSARESTPRRSLFDLGGGGRQLRRSTQPLTIEVLPRPANFPGNEWLPAQNLTLEESWSTPPEKLQVGESATRTITIRGEGLQGAQLPPVLFPSTQGLKYYPDQPVINDSESDSGLVGTRVDSVAVVPTQAGHWEIPELRIPWWDTKTNEVRYAVLPARELDVSAGSAPPVVSAPPQPAPEVVPAPSGAGMIPVVAEGDSRLWQAVSAVTGAGWLLTLVYLIWSRRRSGPETATAPENTREAPAYRTLMAACAAGNATEARQALIAWTAALASRPQLSSLSQVCSTFDDPAMTAAVNALNAALYGSSGGDWQGADLAEVSKALRARYRDASSAKQQPLQLYPG